MPGTTPGAQVAYAACIVGIAVYTTAFVATWWLPEPAEELED
jgi:hypothetical protein